MNIDQFVRGTQTPAAVLFDLDGTLLDSAPDLVAALNWLRTRDGLDEIDVSDMSPFASRGAVGLLNAGYPTNDSGLFEQRRLAFLERYAANSYKQSSLYEGVGELIEYLNRSAMPWGIVTNKIESLTLPILRQSGLASSVSCVVCGDTIEFSKPHPAPVLLACEIIGITPERVLFVGDDVRDVEAGEAAGTLTAAALYGYGSGEFTDELIAGSLVLEHSSQLHKILSDSG